MTYLPSNTATPFLPEQVVYSEDLSQLLIQLTNLFSQNSVATNIREISIYDLIPIVTGQQWYNLVTPQSKRFGFREVFAFTTIPAGATLTIAHGIPNLAQLTTVAGGVVTAVPDFRCLPYVSATVVTSQIEVNVDATNIYIINGATAPAIASGCVVIEYLQN